MKKFARVFTLAVIFLVSACTSGPELKDYPQNQSERPYTLPTGVASWKTDLLTTLKYQKGETALIIIPNFFDWRIALANNWTLNLGVQPSLSRQIFRTPDLIFGSSFGIGTGVASNAGFVYSPNFRIYQRQRFSDRLFLIMEPTAAVYFATKGETTRAWRAGGDIEIRLQATETFYAQSGIGLYYSESDFNDYYDEDSLVASRNNYLTVPLAIRTGWSFARQWDFDASYALYALGYENGYVRHTLHLYLVHFW